MANKIKLPAVAELEKLIKRIRIWDKNRTGHNTEDIKLDIYFYGKKNRFEIYASADGWRTICAVNSLQELFDKFPETVEVELPKPAKKKPRKSALTAAKILR